LGWFIREAQQVFAEDSDLEILGRHLLQAGFRGL